MRGTFTWLSLPSKTIYPDQTLGLIFSCNESPSSTYSPKRVLSKNVKLASNMAKLALALPTARRSGALDDYAPRQPTHCIERPDHCPGMFEWEFSAGAVKPFFLHSGVWTQNFRETVFSSGLACPNVCLPLFSHLAHSRAVPLERQSLGKFPSGLPPRKASPPFSSFARWCCRPHSCQREI